MSNKDKQNNKRGRDLLDTDENMDPMEDSDRLTTDPNLEYHYELGNEEDWLN